MADKVVNGVLLKCPSPGCSVSWVNQLTMGKKGALEKLDSRSTIGCPNCGMPIEFPLAKLWSDQGFPQYTQAVCNCNGCGGNVRWAKVA